MKGYDAHMIIKDHAQFQKGILMPFEEMERIHTIMKRDKQIVTGIHTNI